MAVTPEEVRRVAGLARLGIPEDQLAGYVGQLNSILGHMEVLQKADVSKAAEPQVAGMPLRADEVTPVPLARPIKAWGHGVRDGFITVPRLATHEGGDEGEES